MTMISGDKQDGAVSSSSRLLYGARRQPAQRPMRPKTLAGVELAPTLKLLKMCGFDVDVVYSESAVVFMTEQEGYLSFLLMDRPDSGIEMVFAGSAAELAEVLSNNTATAEALSRFVRAGGGQTRVGMGCGVAGPLSDSDEPRPIEDFASLAPLQEWSIYNWSPAGWSIDGDIFGEAEVIRELAQPFYDRGARTFGDLVASRGGLQIINERLREGQLFLAIALDKIFPTA